MNQVYYNEEFSNSNSNCECRCVEGLARQLRDRRGSFVRVFEKSGATARGTIREVVNNSVLILRSTPGVPNTPAKQTCTCTGQTQTEVFAEIIISLCEITEFAVELRTT